ncbi:MAG: hypothetical protein R3360_06970, partial [Alphaproteobacteria bacterium]|nr:hypothetical protein [Alphaproteobacteria bacterium]
ALKRLPQADWARAELLDISLSLGAWDDAEKALERMIRKDELSAKDARHQRAVIKLLRAHEAEGRKEARLAARLADEALDFDSALAPARALRARLYRQAGKTRRAIKTLKEGWSRAPHPLLAEEWMDLHPEESHTQRYKSLQGLTDTNPTHAESHAVLTRYALEAGLNGGARRHAEALKEREPSERAFDLLAQVEEAEGHIAAAEDARRRRADAEEDPAWRCSRCGHEEEDWSERCGGCGSFATIEWVRQEPQHFAPGSGPAKPGPSRAKADTASPGSG